MILREFERLGKVAGEFDEMFGTHQKIISSLEKYEKENRMSEFKAIVDRLYQDLSKSDEISFQLLYGASTSQS